jgi:DNA primase
MQVEGRLKADIRVTTLPDGLDPDEIALDDPDLWDQLVREARPVVVHVMETLAAHADIEDPKTKEQIANQVLPLIGDVKGSVEREAYRQRLARLLKVDERALVRRASGGTARPRRRSYRQMPQVSAVPASPLTSTHRQLEENCIKSLVSDPTLIHFVDRALRGMELVCLNDDDFTQTDFKELFKLVSKALDQDDEDPAEYVRKRIPDEMQESFLIEADQNPYPDWRLQPNASILESLLNSFIRLRRIRVDEGLDQITFLQTQMTAEDEENPTQDLSRLALEFIQARAKLDQALQLSNSQDKQ